MGKKRAKAAEGMTLGVPADFGDERRIPCDDPEREKCRDLPQPSPLERQAAQQKRAKRALDVLCAGLTNAGGIAPEAMLGAMVEVIAELIMGQEEPEWLLGSVVTGIVAQSTGAAITQQRRRETAKLMFEDAQGSA